MTAITHTVKGSPMSTIRAAALSAALLAVLKEHDIDLVVSVCDNARETCPIFPKPVKRIHVGFHDPHGEPLESFIAVRDDIRARLVPAVREALGL